MPENLSSVFTAIAYKKLVPIDLPGRGPGHGHQHELDGVARLREFFREGPLSGDITWHYFSDDQDVLSEAGYFKFYDARENHPTRTEWRLYYSGEFLKHARARDVLLLLRLQNGNIHGLIFAEDSSWLRSAEFLFPIPEARKQLLLIPDDLLQEQQLDFARRRILEELGIEAEVPVLAGDEDLAAQELAAARRNNRDFPTTARMSELARSLVQVDYRDGDSALIALVDREERLFRAMEKILVEERLRRHFTSVDDFISYSLSVQNRRKSRMGYALQNHLAHIFTENRLRFEPQVHTEGNRTPDFLFPGSREYHDQAFPADLLVMLAAKSSCKERWRQILDEADRIPGKHLCTLEPSISTDQLDMMAERKVQLVVPRTLHTTYNPDRLDTIWSVNRFIEHVRTRQALP